MLAEHINGFIGGVLIGIAATMLFYFNGKVMGVSGIISNLLQKNTQDIWWRLSFLFGLIAGGIIYSPLNQIKLEVSIWQLILAGLLVGFGTVVGNGCTSGHGICGIARFSKRSIVATMVFILTGMITVYFKKILGGL